VVKLEDADNPTAAIHRTVDGRIVVILLVAAALRLAWIATLPSDDASLVGLPDQIEYLELGRNVALHQGLKFHDDRFDDVVYAYRTPGYPLVVAMCGGDVQLIRAFQALLDTASVFGVYLLGNALSRKRQALFAAGIIALNPFLIYFCGLILSETLFAAMLVWGMVLVTRKNSIAWWSGTIVLALSVLARPSAILLPVLLCATSAFVNRETAKRGEWMRRGLSGAIVTIVVLLPWAWRNDRVLGQWIWTTTNSGITQYDGFNPDATGGSDQKFVTAMPQLKSMNEVERSQYLGKLARNYVREHPLHACWLGILKVARTWSPIPLSREYGSSAKIVAVAAIYMVPLDVLIVLGLWHGRAGIDAKRFLMIPAIYFTVVHALSVGSLRYRIPADLPMAIVAALAVRAPPADAKEPRS
jgi:4-amino-4-deoxy-L-arabinose transferase-like glycosyltransferase